MDCFRQQFCLRSLPGVMHLLHSSLSPDFDCIFFYAATDLGRSRRVMQHLHRVWMSSASHAESQIHLLLFVGIKISDQGVGHWDSPIFSCWSGFCLLCRSCRVLGDCRSAKGLNGLLDLPVPLRVVQVSLLSCDACCRPCATCDPR